MKKTIFFISTVLLYSCSKQAPSIAAPAQPIQSPTCDTCAIPNNYENLPLLEIQSSDWETDSSGGIKKDLVALYFLTYPWEYAAGKIVYIVIDDAGLGKKAIRQGESLAIFGGFLDVKETEIQFRGALSLLPDTLRLAVAF